jgi:allantoicase
VDTSGSASFTGLVDLAAEAFGGRALHASDDFFAGVENMLKPGRGVFIEGKFTERGKWMDGWESRRKRGGGHDHAIVALGACGEVLGLDIDTHHFVGNHPPFAAVEGVLAPRDATVEQLAHAPWRSLLVQSPLRPDAQNLFAPERIGPVSHVRLSIFPDGGVARFRVFGRVQGALAAGDPYEDPRDADTTAHVAPDWIDLAALRNGALALACSDAFFGPMNNLLLPGRADNMGGGWETRRKRQPGHDYILIQLAARGRIRQAEVDTHHFRGNYPDRCAIEVIDAPGARITDLIAATAYSALVPETKLSASTRHFVTPRGPDVLATHARLNIYPDGGVSRLRLWGERDG